MEEDYIQSSDSAGVTVWGHAGLDNLGLPIKPITVPRRQRIQFRMQGNGFLAVLSYAMSVKRLARLLKEKQHSPLS